MNALISRVAIFLGVCAGIFVLSACELLPGSNGGGDLADRSWLLTKLENQELVPGTSISIQFTADGKVSGSSGCNRYSGSYTASGTRIQISSPMAMTRMACVEDIMNQETAYMEALEQVETYSISGDTLTLANTGDKKLLVYTVQSQDLSGIPWEVLSYNNGKQAVTSVMASTTITLEFGKDGSVSGSTGCNSYSGSYKLDGRQIEISPLAATMMFCAEPAGVMDQETLYLAALQTTGKYSIESDMLELRTSDGALAVQATVASPADPTPTDAGSGSSIKEFIWQWTTLIDQSAGETTEVPDPERYTITFHDNGSLDGIADCNTYGGEYSQENGFSIKIGASTMAFCGEESLDQKYLSLLSSIAAGGPDGAGGLVLETAGGAQRMLFRNGGNASK